MKSWNRVCRRAAQTSCPGRALFFVTAPALWHKAIADPGLSLDVLLACLSFELFPQLSHEDAQVFRLVGGLRSPNRGKQGAMGNDLARMAGQVEQQVKLFRRQVNGPAQYGD